MMDRGARLFTKLLRLYPPAFRDRYRSDLLAFFRQDRADPRYGSGPLRPLRFWTATIRDLTRAAWTQRRDARRKSLPIAVPRASVGDRWRRDARFAWRGLWATPVATLAAMAVLTIGIGATTAIFSVVDAVVLRGLPYPNDDELVLLRESNGYGRGRMPVQPQTYVEWRDRQQVFSHIGASGRAPGLTTIDDPIATLTPAQISASFLDVLGIAPAFGRPFNQSDERPGARPVAILSHSVWRNRFASNRAIVGQTITFKTGIVEIVGVMPPHFRYPSSVPADVLVPFITPPELTVRGRMRRAMLTVIGRLRPGVSVDQAGAHMTSLHEAVAAQDPAWFKGSGVIAQRWKDSFVSGPVQSWMMLLLTAVAGVLLIACLNVANLLVARALRRAPDLAIRTALGASRWDLSRTLLIESLMLSLLGAAGGVLLAFWGVDFLRANLPANVPRLATVAVNLRVIAFAAAAAVATGLVFGILPALQVLRSNLISPAGFGIRQSAGGRVGRRLRTALVIGEVAIASVLLVGSGLFLSSFVRVTNIDLGFDPRHVVALTGGTISSSGVRPPETPEDRAKAMSAQTIVTNALAQLRAVPEVTAVAAVSGGSPLGGSRLTMEFRPTGSSEADSVEEEPDVRSATSGYLDVLRGTMVRGRWIADTDVLGGEPVIVISDETARRYFGADDPVGRRVLLGNPKVPYTVIGIVRAMRARGPEVEPGPEVFVPFFQGSHTTAQLLVRTRPDPMTIVPALHAAVRSVLPPDRLRADTLEQDYARLLAQRRFNMIVLVLFGVVAIIVAALGIYGVMAYLVEQRRHEIGVRVALGAAPAGILGMVLWRATSLMLAGLALGVIAAVLLERLVRAFLFEPRPFDPMVYGGVALILLAAGLAAASGPARRAVRVDPLVALRTE